MITTTVTWHSDDPRPKFPGKLCMFLAFHKETKQSVVGAMTKYGGVKFGGSHYWPGKPWDNSYLWALWPSPYVHGNLRSNTSVQGAAK